MGSRIFYTAKVTTEIGYSNSVVTFLVWVGQIKFNASLRKNRTKESSIILVWRNGVYCLVVLLYYTHIYCACNIYPF